jgi:hypothetical protein
MIRTKMSRIPNTALKGHFITKREHGYGYSLKKDLQTITIWLCLCVSELKVEEVGVES